MYLRTIGLNLITIGLKLRPIGLIMWLIGLKLRPIGLYLIPQALSIILCCGCGFF